MPFYTERQSVLAEIHFLSEQKLGVLALGVFVGFLLGLGLMKSGPTLKTVLTVIGAALGGAPVLFMSDTSQKWMYPIGLLNGLLCVRAMGARLDIAAKVARPSKARKLHGWFAWFDLIVIAAVIIAASGYALLSKREPGFEQTGSFKLMPFGEIEIFYPRPYQSTPNLTFPSANHNPHTFRLIEQRSDGFKIRTDGIVTKDSVVDWRADGRPID